MRKVSAMLEGHDSITRLKRLYFAFISRAGGGAATSSKAAELAEAADESPFSKPHALMRLGRTIMDLKVSNVVMSVIVTILLIFVIL